MQFNDRVSVNSGTNRTKDGYLAATARVARSGVQLYSGVEVGRPDLQTVRVFRPESEVFDDATMRSFAHRPMTLEHPSSQVNSSNWRDVAIGNTGGKVHRDGDYVVVDLAVMDEGSIKALEAGTRELSCGYNCELDFESGTTPSGEPYDAVQRKIRNNHVALVNKARGGSSLRVGDSATDDARAQARADHERWRRQQPAAVTVGDANQVLDSHYREVLDAKGLQVQAQLRELADTAARQQAFADHFSEQIAARDTVARSTPRDRAYADSVAALDYRGRG